MTLTGSGGSGKTRLALETAFECISSFAGGAWIAEFAPLAEGQAVARSIASALGIREQPGKDETVTICEELRTKELLLIMDNCEHVLDACAEVAEAILRAAPNVHILATSRAAIGISGETILRIPSMTLPDSSDKCSPEELEKYDATKLFLERAHAVDSSFEFLDSNCEVVVQICRRLDGIPLAIELAASRLKGMAIGQLAERLDDRFRILTGGSRTAVSRQRTLRALIDWSYDLLSEKEGSLLRYMSVFAGGWTVEAAEFVGATGDIEREEVLELLASLVEKSLAFCEQQADGRGRYRLLETIRQYAADKLAERKEAEATRTRHLRFFEQMLDRRESLFGSPTGLSSTEKSNETRRTLATGETAEQRDIIVAVDKDWENIRAAIEWALATEPAVGLRLAAGLAGYYERRMKIVEGTEIVRHALMASEQLGNTRDRFRAYFLAARLALRRADMEAAQEMAENACRLAEILRMETGLAQAKAMIGNVYTNIGRYADARKVYAEIHEVGVRLEDPELRARSCYARMLLARAEGNLKEFLAFADEAKRDFDLAGMPLWVNWTESYMGWYAEQSGQLAKAARIYEKVMREMLDSEVNVGVIWHWECMARVCVLANMHSTAAQLFAAAADYRRKTGWPVQPTEIDRIEGARQNAERELGDDYTRFIGLGKVLSFEQACKLTTEAEQEIQRRFAVESPRPE